MFHKLSPSSRKLNAENLLLVGSSLFSSTHCWQRHSHLSWQRFLQISLLTLLVSSCGGGGGGGSDMVITPPTTPTALSAADELQAAIQIMAEQTQPTQSFYDLNRDGTQRVVRNDLTNGALQGQVQFAQSHTIDPRGNTEKNMPTLVSLRSALLLFTPTDNGKLEKISVEVWQDGVLKSTLNLVPPSLQPRSDYIADASGRADVVYSNKAWSTLIDWSYMRLGLQLVFKVGGGQGTLASNAIEFSPPSEIVIHNIKLGMLTAPPEGQGQYMHDSPAQSATDYFQTIPVSRMVMANYAPMQLDRVIVARGATNGGVIYSASNPNLTEGGVYEGNMREDVGKAQVSTGINLANFGVSDDTMTQRNPQIFNHRVIHHSQGLYSNGVQQHGLSGGNGMATLYQSVGNELSHELGHSYGLGHYPGTTVVNGKSTNLYLASHHADSGWGYIAYRKRMRANLRFDKGFDAESGYFSMGEGENKVTFAEDFAKKYHYNTDAMSGGVDNSGSISKYTHHTGYSMMLIQKHLSARPVPDVSFPSGYKAWKDGKYVDVKVVDPTFAYPKPSKVGVPVVTLLGGYHATNSGLNLLYPAFRGSYGNVFDLSEPDSSGDACWLAVEFADGSKKNVALTYASAIVRQVNVNIEASRDPRKASVVCRAGTVSKTMSTIDIGKPGIILPAAVVVGQELEYSALRQVELSALAPKLLTAANPSALDSESVEVLTSWRGQLGGLPPNALTVANKFFTLNDAAVLVEAFIVNNKSSLSTNVGQQKNLADLVLSSSLLPSTAGRPIFPTGKAIRPLDKNNTDRCIVQQMVGGKPELAKLQGNACKDVADQRWFFDSSGRIRNEARPDQCITNNSSDTIVLRVCGQAVKNQQWTQLSDGRILLSSNQGATIDCVCQDPNRNPILYGAGNGPTVNNAWTALPQDTSSAWQFLSASTIEFLRKNF